MYGIKRVAVRASPWCGKSSKGFGYKRHTHRQLMHAPTLLPALVVCAVSLLCVPASASGIIGDICVIEGSSWTEAPLQGGPHTSGTFESFPDGASLSCTTCDLGWPQGLFTNEHYIHLGQSNIFVFGATSCELYDSLDLNGECSPKHIQRSLSEANRYYIICHEGDRYQQLNYGLGQFYLMNERVRPSGAPLAIVKGTNGDNIEVDYLAEIDVAENAIYFTELSTGTSFYHFLGDSDECATPTGVNPTAPKSNGDPRVVVSCNGQNGESLRYIITAERENPISIDAEGTPIHSPKGEYLLIVKEQGFVLYDTINYQQVHRSYTTAIDEIRFAESGAGLFLTIAMATQPLRLVIVDEFFTSGGQSGEGTIDGTATMCPGGTCLPHGVTGLDSERYYVFIQDGALITFLLLSLTDLSLPPTRVRNINSQPDLALVFITPTPTPSISPPPEVSSTLLNPTPTPTPTSSSSSSSPPPGTDGPPEPTPTPETEPTTDTPPTAPSSVDSGDTGGSGITVVIIVVVFILVVFVLVVIGVIAMVVFCRKRRRFFSFNCLIKKPIPVSLGQHNLQFDPENRISASSNEEAGLPPQRQSLDRPGSSPRLLVTQDGDDAVDSRTASGSGRATPAPSNGTDSGFTSRVPTQNPSPIPPHKQGEGLCTNKDVGEAFHPMNPAESAESLAIDRSRMLSPLATTVQPTHSTGLQLAQVVARLGPSASASTTELPTASFDADALEEWKPPLSIPVTAAGSTYTHTV